MTVQLTLQPSIETHDYCDRAGHWVAQGTTRPMQPRSIYRICTRCVRLLGTTWCPRCKQPFNQHPANRGCPGRAA